MTYVYNEFFFAVELSLVLKEVKYKVNLLVLNINFSKLQLETNLRLKYIYACIILIDM